MLVKSRLEVWNPGEDRELVEQSVIRKFRITATDGKNRDTGHYNRSAIFPDRLFVLSLETEVMRIARNEAESGNDKGGAE